MTKESGHDIIRVEQRNERHKYPYAAAAKRDPGRREGERSRMKNTAWSGAPKTECE